VAPPLTLSFAVPRLVVLSRNVTVPVGTLLPDWGATTAVNVTLCDGRTAVEEAVSVVVVASAPVGPDTTAATVTLTADETELPSLLSPP
jgi:hypothetical protein